MSNPAALIASGRQDLNLGPFGPEAEPAGSHGFAPGQAGSEPLGIRRRAMVDASHRVPSERLSRAAAVAFVMTPSGVAHHACRWSRGGACARTRWSSRLGRQQVASASSPAQLSLEDACPC